MTTTFKTYGHGPCRAHLRTNSKSSVEVSPLSISSSHVHTSGIEGIQLRPSPFSGVTTPKIELDQPTLPSIAEDGALYSSACAMPQATALGLAATSQKHTVVNRNPPSTFAILSSVLHSSRLQEVIYPLVFFISLGAFLAPLAGIGYHRPTEGMRVPLHDNLRSHSVHSGTAFPLHLTPISAKDIGPLFVLPSSKHSHHGAVRANSFSASVSDSSLHASGLKPFLEPHDAGKPDLLSASPILSVHSEAPDTIFAEVVSVVEPHVAGSVSVESGMSQHEHLDSDVTDTQLADPGIPPIKPSEFGLTPDQPLESGMTPNDPMEVSVTQDWPVEAGTLKAEAESLQAQIPSELKSDSEEEELARRSVQEELTLSEPEEAEEEDFLEEDPEISDDSESPDEVEPTSSLTSYQSNTLERSEQQSEKEGSEVNPEVKKEESTQSVLEPPGSKTKELESLLESIAPVFQEPFTDPAVVEALSGRKGLRARQFR